MHDTNLSDAFASYHAKPVRRGRSAMTTDGDLVISCWYTGFKRAQVHVLKYEEDLSGQTDDAAMAFRAHLTDALSNECAVRVIVAVAIIDSKGEPAVAVARMTYYPRKDLVGRVSSFDGERLVVEFRKNTISAPGRLPKGALPPRRSGLAERR